MLQPESEFALSSCQGFGKQTKCFHRHRNIAQADPSSRTLSQGIANTTLFPKTLLAWRRLPQRSVSSGQVYTLLLDEICSLTTRHLAPNTASYETIRRPVALQFHHLGRCSSHWCARLFLHKKEPGRTLLVDDKRVLRHSLCVCKLQWEHS